MDKFSIAEDLAAATGGLSPDLFGLNYLSKHNDQVERDASLVRIDSYFGVEPYLIAPGLINDVLNYGLDGSVDAGAEAALFLRGFGGDNGNSTATFLQEMFPEGWTKTTT